MFVLDVQHRGKLRMVGLICAAGKPVEITEAMFDAIHEALTLLAGLDAHDKSRSDPAISEIEPPRTSPIRLSNGPNRTVHTWKGLEPIPVKPVVRLDPKRIRGVVGSLDAALISIGAAGSPERLAFATALQLSKRTNFDPDRWTTSAADPREPLAAIEGLERLAAWCRDAITASTPAKQVVADRALYAGLEGLCRVLESAGIRVTRHEDSPHFFFLQTAIGFVRPNPETKAILSFLSYRRKLRESSGAGWIEIVEIDPETSVERSVD